MVETRLVEIKHVKEGNYVLIDGEPCRVVKLMLSKPGKHGSEKARLEAIGLFDGRRRSIVKPASAQVNVPIIEKRNAQVISIQGSEIQLMDLEDYSTFFASLPEELKGKVNEGDEIHYWKIGERVLIKGKK